MQVIFEWKYFGNGHNTTTVWLY